MQRHVFDMSESATHELVAKQLRDLASQFQAGSVELAYDESHAPAGFVDPADAAGKPAAAITRDTRMLAEMQPQD